MKKHNSTPAIRRGSAAFVFGISLILILFLAAGAALAQSSSAVNTKAGTTNFYEIQQQFNDYWKGRTVTKGSGYNLFRRWEWFWEQRVDREGNFPPNDIVVREWNKYSSDHSADNTMGATANWTSMGPDSTKGGYAGLGRVNCIAFHPTNASTFWIGTPSGGIWKTVDFGKNWTTNYNSQPVLGVSDIVIDPNDPQIMYAATGDGDFGSLSALTASGKGDNKSVGVLKSTDGGQTWNPTGLSWEQSFMGLIRVLVMNKVNSSMLLAATTNGIYKTINGGTTFIQKKDGYFIDIAFNPGNPLILYAATCGIRNSNYQIVRSAQIYRSIDGGESWDSVTQFANVGRIKLAVTPQRPEMVEALCTNAINGLDGLKVSTENGLNFTEFLSVNSDCSNNMLNTYTDPSLGSNPCNGQGHYDLCYLINPVNTNERWLGGVNTWKSNDPQGKIWVPKTMWTANSSQNPLNLPVTHADKHWFAFHPLQPGTLFDANDGGIYYTSDGGNNWTDISMRLTIGQLYRIGCSYSNPDLIMGGFQDNGSQQYNSGKWLAPNVIGGDGMECLVDYINPNIKYASYCNGVIKRTTDANWLYDSVSVISRNIPSDNVGAWVTPYIIHPSNPAILYVGYREIFKTINRGDDWTKASTLPAPVAGDETLRTMCISKSRPGLMYAATKFTLFKTTNDWTSQESIALPASNIMLTGIAIHPKRSDTVYITFSGYTAGSKVFRSFNGGRNWENISGTLPNLPVNCIEYQENANDGLYIGTDAGVYFRNSGMTDWMLFSGGLPNVVVTELEIQYMIGKIRAATYGRGVWQSDLYIANGTYQVNAVSIPANAGIVGGGGTFQPGAKANMLAQPGSGWSFDGWYENAAKVSPDKNYTFDVNSSRNLTGKFIVNTGISDTELKSQIRLFPNPTKGIVNISMESRLQNDLAKVVVTGMDGRTVYEALPSRNGEVYSVDLSSCQNGSYLLTIYFKAGGKVTYQVMVKW